MNFIGLFDDHGALDPLTAQMQIPHPLKLRGVHVRQSCFGALRVARNTGLQRVGFGKTQNKIPYQDVNKTGLTQAHPRLNPGTTKSESYSTAIRGNTRLTLLQL